MSEMSYQDTFRFDFFVRRHSQLAVGLAVVLPVFSDVGVSGNNFMLAMLMLKKKIIKKIFELLARCENQKSNFLRIDKN